MATTPTRPPFNPTPKQRFLQSGDSISKHRTMVDSHEFQRAIDFAQMQYIRALCDTAPTDLTGGTLLQASACAFQRIQGMNDFITILRSLSETPPPRAERPSDNLKEN